MCVDVKMITLVVATTLISACASDFPEAPESYAGVDGGTAAIVEIGASPSPAWIFVDGVYVGVTPLRYEMSFNSETAYLSVVAVPMNSSQTRQEKRIQVPPLPKHLHYFLNNASETAASNGL